jgi:outer membrane protein assembly factor BamE
MLRGVLLGGLIALLVGCGIYEMPHLRTAQQGNLIEEDQVRRLRNGMSKAQVEDIMGSPLRIATFNPERWEYVYTKKNRKAADDYERLLITFRNQRVVHIAQSNQKPKGSGLD